MNWTITQLEVKKQEGDLDNVVITATWRCEATGAVPLFITSDCTLPAPSGDFTPYEDLTEEQVLGWVWANGVDKAEMEAVLAARIEAQINPPVTTPPLPWSEG